MTIDESACVDNILLRSDRIAIATVDTAVIAHASTVLRSSFFNRTDDDDSSICKANYECTSIPKYRITLLFAHFSKYI